MDEMKLNDWGIPLEEAVKKPVKKLAKKISTPSVSIPKGYQKFVDGSGDLSSVKTWKVQIQVGNSLGRESPSVGGWDNVGYVFVNPKTKEIVPIARGDEHHSGWELMRDLQSDGVVKNIKEFVPIYIHGTHVYDSEDKEKSKQAFQTWLDLGGEDIKVEIYRSGSVGDGQSFLGSLSDFIAAKSFVPVKGEIAKPGQQLIQALEKYARAVVVALKDSNKEPAANKAAEWILHVMNQYRMFLTGRKDLEEALKDGDFQKIQDAVLGFDGLKNNLHQNLRDTVSGTKKWDQDMIKIFGDPAAALKAFDVLSSI